MLDHVNNYIMSPLSLKFEELTQFSKTFPKISANFVSFFGVFIAFISAKVLLINENSIVMRRLAVLIFEFRQFLDDLDGLVARIRLGLDKRKELSLKGTNGYLVDGICDAIGFTLFLIAVFIYLKRKQNSNQTKYQLLITNENNRTTETTKTLFNYCLLFGLQLLLSSILWNRYIDKFHQLLELNSNQNNLRIRLEIMKSSFQWIIWFFWRLINAHNLMQFFLLSVWFNKTQEFLRRIHFFGFFIILLIAFLTEIQLNDVMIDSIIIK